MLLYLCIATRSPLKTANFDFILPEEISIIQFVVIGVISYDCVLSIFEMIQLLQYNRNYRY